MIGIAWLVSHARQFYLTRKLLHRLPGRKRPFVQNDGPAEARPSEANGADESKARTAFPWRIVLWGVALQLLFGLFVLRTPAGLQLFGFLNDAVVRLLGFTAEGSRFLFGDYLDFRFSMALQVLPTIIFFSALMAVLYHLGIMQRVVFAFSWIMQKTLRTSGPETLAASANIFVGQTEAPLLIKPYLKTMSRSEINAVMVGGFANVAGGVLAAYVGMLHTRFPGIAGHLIASSVMSAPASLLIAKVMLGEDKPSSIGAVAPTEPAAKSPYANLVDAAASGASEGLTLALNVAAMLLAFVALVAMVNYLFELPALLHNRGVWQQTLTALHGRTLSDAVCHGESATESAGRLSHCIELANQTLGTSHVAWTPWSMERILGYCLWPLAWLMGVPAHECTTVASLLGEKTILNEFVAYVSLSENLTSAEPLSDRSRMIASYALCGFANLSSIAIQIGGIGALVPERRSEIATLGFKAMIGGSLATFMTACVAGLMG